MNDLNVVTQQYADRTVITVAGEMDLHTCPALAQATLVIPLNGKTLHLEMSGVTFMDSSGLNFLLQLRRRLLADDGQLALSGLRGHPARVLHLTGAYDLLVPGDTGAPDGDTAKPAGAPGRDDLAAAGISRTEP
ncbi:STAS domain-containing protein [Streptomyces sp. NPDC048664]|uniref:STAS domain-containing protein n=1 Tax=Streptomyces sp. NPDC048664 TaxID=3154505 RepID=UPI003412E55B